LLERGKVNAVSAASEEAGQVVLAKVQGQLSKIVAVEGEDGIPSLKTALSGKAQC
jgi:hypothetical protein